MKFSKAILALPILLILITCENQTQTGQNVDWSIADSIVGSIQSTNIPDRSVNFVEEGAVSGNRDNLPLLNKLMARLSDEGGGRIIVPPGEYFLQGPIHFESNIELHLEEGAVLKFSTNPDDYLPPVFSRWEGIELYNYSALLYAKDKGNIAITGRGILDGQASADNWWPWKGKKEYGWMEGMPSQLEEYGQPKLAGYNESQEAVENRVFGEGGYLRPNFVQFMNCSRILIEGVTFKDSPMWFIHPVLSENIIIRGVSVTGAGPNNDGCDPESCRYVLIENCFFDTGDDCIAIKSGRNQDGRRIAASSENIVVRGCEMKDGHGGVVIGSEISGGCRNVFVENCNMSSPNLDRAIRLKSNSYRGGIIENLFVRNVKVGQVKGAVIRMNMRYAPNEGSDGNYLPVFRNIFIDSITSEKSMYALRLEGLSESKIINVQIKDCDFNGVAEGNIIENTSGLVVENSKINGESFKN